jgi:putative ABC transport system permease protein
VFASLNTMYSAVASRTKEIATLKALGFHAAPIVGSILSEAMLLALIGGLIGATIAWLSFDGFTASTVGATYSQLSFRFAVTRDLIFTGIGIALVLGVVGGLLPAIRAVKLPVVAGLAALR